MTPTEVRTYAMRCAFHEYPNSVGGSVCSWSTPRGTYVATLDVHGAQGSLRAPDVDAGPLPVGQGVSLVHAYIFLATLAEIGEPMTFALLHTLYGSAPREITS